jgi:hypothetical protein
MTITDLSEMLGVPVVTLYGWRHGGEAHSATGSVVTFDTAGQPSRLACHPSRLAPLAAKATVVEPVKLQATVSGDREDSGQGQIEYEAPPLGSIGPPRGRHCARVPRRAKSRSSRTSLEKALTFHCLSRQNRNDVYRRPGCLQPVWSGVLRLVC